MNKMMINIMHIGVFIGVYNLCTLSLWRVIQLYERSLSPAFPETTDVRVTDNTKAWLMKFTILMRIEVKSMDGFHCPMEYIKCETLS